MYRARLRSLQAKEPALKYSPEAMTAISIDVSTLTGTRYKVLDDLLDGIFCAYLAHYFWYWGEERCWVVGDMNDGYVNLPRCSLPNCQLSVGPANILRS
jgi:predicted RNase H-like nuclease